MFWRAGRILLFPFALIYGIIGSIRNFLYNVGAFRSKSFPLPIISVGNIRVGGTGKTPHIEYLIRLLHPRKRVATLSRGYGRNTRGFQLATAESTADEIGDEPRQFRQKFTSIIVAVDGDRVRGVQKLLRNDTAPEVVLLDDAFQHRAIQPGLSILLTDFSKPFFQDLVLPAGNLREWSTGKRRADIMIVTKCPVDLTALDRRAYRDRVRPKPYQHVFFTYLAYGALESLFAKNVAARYPLSHYQEKGYEILLVSGIANPKPLEVELHRHSIHFKHLSFPDHHRYTEADVKKIQNIFDSFAAGKKLILTTEKDGMRLVKPNLASQIEHLPVFFLPIEVAFHGNDGEEFNELIVNYVGRNQINSGLPKK